MLYWVLKYVLLGPLLRVLYRPKVTGLENVPADGPVIMAMNHNAFVDSFFVPLMVKRPMTFLAKDEYFITPGFKGFWMRVFFKGVGQVPINRAGGNASEAALVTGVKVLSAGDILGIYPEGTRSPDGKLYRGHTGAARMALAAKVRVIPVGVKGTRAVQPPGKRIPRIKKITIDIGEPLDFSRYDGMENDRFVLRSMTDEIMYEIMQLCGQEYSDMYASKAKKLIKERSREGVASMDDLDVDSPAPTDSVSPTG